MKKEMSTKLVIQTYLKILKDGIVEESLRLGMYLGTLYYILFSGLFDKYGREDPEWYYWVVLGAIYVVFLRAASTIVSRIYIRIRTRNLNDGP